MASEEIKLIGSFKDDITPQLKKLNKQIDAIGRSFSKFSRNLRPMSKEFGRLAMSSKTFNDTLKAQRSLIQGNARAMRDYKSQAGKMVSSMRSIQSEHSKMMRAQGMSRAEQKRAARAGTRGGGRLPGMPAPAMPSALPRAPKMPKAPRSRIPAPAPVPAPAPAKAPKTTGKNATAAGAAAGQAAGQGFMKSVAATAIGMTIANAFASGVSKLKNLITMPFQKFGSMFSERINDEMDDIKSAGGLYALDMDLTQQSGNERFFKNYNEALRFQEKLNISMAESAASLPGVTSQYVDTSRQLTDTIQMVMDKDREGFQEYGKLLGADVSVGGVGADKNAFQKVLQKQTEQVMLMSQGQTGGLPMHIALQQLLSKEKDKKGGLGMQGFVNKYRAAFQKNPMLKNMLMRAEKDMAETGANSVERLKSIMDVFNKALPKEQINKMRGSLSGLIEGLRSGLLDPQAGLFGMSRASIAQGSEAADSLGRQLKKNVDDFGNQLFMVTEDLGIDENLAKKMQDLGIDAKVGGTLKSLEFTAEQLDKLGIGTVENGKIISKMAGKTGEIGTASMSTTYIFEQIRETIAGFAPPLLEFVGFLPHIFDPFAKITAAFNKEGGFRDAANNFISGFNKAVDAVDKEAMRLMNSANKDVQRSGNLLKEQSRTRAAFYQTAKLLQSFGSTDGTLNKALEDVKTKMSDVTKGSIDDFNPIEEAKTIINALINSDFMIQIGDMLGTVAGGIARGMFDFITGIFTLAEGPTANKFLEGFTKGVSGMFDDLATDSKSATEVVTDKLIKVLSTIFIRIGDLLVNQVLPLAGKLVVDSLVGLIMTGNPIGMIIGALGLKKIGGMVIGAVKSLIPGMSGLKGGATNAAQALNQAAMAARNFSKGALGTTPYGPKTQAAAKGAGLRGGMKKVTDFFLGSVKKAKGIGGALSAGSKVGAQAGGGVGGAMKAVSATGKVLAKSVGAGLKSGLKLGALGAAIKTIIALFEGKSPLDAISEGLASAGGAAIGAAIGTIIFPGIGTAIGAFIGGEMGSIPEVVEGFKQALGAIGVALSGVWESLSSVFVSLFDSFSGVLNMFGILSGAGEEVDQITAIVIAVKVALTPIVAAFQLLGQAINLVVLLFHGMKFTFAQITASILTGIGNALGPFGGKIRELGATAQAQADLAKSQGEETVKRMQKQFEADSKFYQTKKIETQATKEAAAAMSKLRDQAKAAGSTFENNKKFKGEDGKFYGWAKKDGKDILVEWGSVATEQIKKVGEVSKEVLDKQASESKKLEETKKKQAEEALKATVENSSKTGDKTIDMLRQGYRKVSKEVSGQGGKKKEIIKWTEPNVGASTSPAAKESAPETKDNMSGLAPTKADMEWYSKNMPDPTPAAVAEPVDPAVAEELKQIAAKASDFSQMSDQNGLAQILANAQEAGADDIITPIQEFDFTSVVDGLNKIAEILNGISDNLAPEGGEMEIASAEPQTTTGPDIDPIKAIVNPVGALVDFVGGMFGGGENAAAPTPASVPELPDLTEPLMQVGQVAEAVGAITEPMNALGSAVEATTAPLTELGPAAESGASGMQAFVSAMEAIPPKVDAALVGAANTAGAAISTAAQGLATALSQAAQSIKNAAQASANVSATTGANAYSGHTGGQGAKTMPLAAAIEKERSMMPSGADLMIANTSETVIPAFAGHLGDNAPFKDLSFKQMESAAGFDGMKTYTEQITEIADRTAANFSGMAGSLGGGSATLNAMEALGNKHGLTTTSGFRPGDPGFHGANRARDLSNGGGETPEMNKVAGIMASQFGQSLTELIYTPLGFSIKNGAKTGLISPDNHYHHIHVAVAEGLSKAAVFSSQRAAENYERSMMPVGAEPMKVNLASMTANSSEFSGGGGVTVGDITVNVTGADDPKEIANKVADEILDAIQRSSYDELFTN